ncbi:MAG: hypothetical protein KF861_02750 [Planctomycetaceae bacterium]|nr:hypothetical protein [Planctomycetaceae bacterium]
MTPNVDAIELEVSFVERPIGDPLLGSRMWSELVTVSTLDPSTATALRRNGFRFGVAGSEPPQNLAAAMGVTGGKYNYHRYSQRSGEEMTIEAWPAYATCDIDIDAAGQSRKKSYEQARCMFRVTPERLQDGWVKLSFIPEIHHGDLKIRPIPGNQGWEQMPSQLIEPLFDQRFSVELNLGEMIVLSADGDNAQSVGHHFFRGGTSENKLQRVLMVRAVGMKRLNLLRE